MEHVSIVTATLLTDAIFERVLLLESAFKERSDHSHKTRIVRAYACLCSHARGAGLDDAGHE
jgi:hypothetical protein